MKILALSIASLIRPSQTTLDVRFDDKLKVDPKMLGLKCKVYTINANTHPLNFGGEEGVEGVTVFNFDEVAGFKALTCWQHPQACRFTPPKVISVRILDLPVDDRPSRPTYRRQPSLTTLVSIETPDSKVIVACQRGKFGPYFPPSQFKLLEKLPITYYGCKPTNLTYKETDSLQGLNSLDDVQNRLLESCKSVPASSQDIKAAVVRYYKKMGRHDLLCKYFESVPSSLLTGEDYEKWGYSAVEVGKPYDYVDSKCVLGKKKGLKSSIYSTCSSERGYRYTDKYRQYLEGYKRFLEKNCGAHDSTNKIEKSCVCVIGNSTSYLSVPLPYNLNCTQ